MKRKTQINFHISRYDTNSDAYKLYREMWKKRLGGKKDDDNSDSQPKRDG